MDQNQKGRVLLLLRLVVDCYLGWSDPTHSTVRSHPQYCSAGAEPRTECPEKGSEVEEGVEMGAVEAMPAKEES